MKRKYQLDTACCTNKLKAIKILLPWCGSLEIANTVFERKELEADPDAEGYRKLIEDLDSIGVAVFDMDRVQKPKFEGVDNENSYT